MPIPTSLVLATRNTHKLREFGASAGTGGGRGASRCPTRSSCRPRTGDTFAANALGKAQAAAAATGRAVIADDSGIEAAALRGAPGVRSARYAGERASDEENLAKLLREAPAGSGLRYVCALAYVDPRSGRARSSRANAAVELAAAPRGEGGFGYDPAFVPAGMPDRTMAELSDVEKDAISHRGHAVRALLGWLRH